MLAKLLYKPFSLVLAAGAQRLAGNAFETAYERRHGSGPPSATTEDATWSQVLGSATARAVTFAVVTTTVDRAGAKTFRYLVGFWPGDAEPPPAKRIRVAGR